VTRTITESQANQQIRSKKTTTKTTITTESRSVVRCLVGCLLLSMSTEMLGKQGGLEEKKETYRGKEKKREIARARGVPQARAVFSQSHCLHTTTLVLISIEQKTGLKTSLITPKILPKPPSAPPHFSHCVFVLRFCWWIIVIPSPPSSSHALKFHPSLFPRSKFWLVVIMFGTHG